MPKGVDDNLNFSPQPDCAVLLAAHGASVNVDSAKPALRHAARLRSRRLFAEVRCGFWKQEPRLTQEFAALLKRSDLRRILVLPFFLAEGYFSQEVIPQALGLARTSTRVGAHEVIYASVPGLHPALADVLVARARRMVACGGLRPEDTSLVLVGHGTDRNSRTGETLALQLERVRKRAIFGECVSAFMEMEPLVARWSELTRFPQVLVVPFFVANGLHAYEDIPVLLGICDKVDMSRPRHFIYSPRGHQLRGRRLWYAPSIGTEPAMTRVLLECAQDAILGPVAKNQSE